MASWKKLLAQMANDPNPKGYQYEDAARVLRQLGFELAPSGSSHRKWRTRLGDPPRTVVVGLVQPPRGPVPKEYIQDMMVTLRANGLVPGDSNGE
jgi:hypothetical protein